MSQLLQSEIDDLHRRLLALDAGHHHGTPAGDPFAFLALQVIGSARQTLAAMSGMAALLDTLTESDSPTAMLALPIRATLGVLLGQIGGDIGMALALMEASTDPSEGAAQLAEVLQQQGDQQAQALANLDQQTTDFGRKAANLAQLVIKSRRRQPHVPTAKRHDCSGCKAYDDACAALGLNAVECAQRLGRKCCGGHCKPKGASGRPRPLNFWPN